MNKLFTLLLSVVGLFTFAQTRTDSIHVAHYDLQLSIVDFSTHVIHGCASLSIVPQINQLPFVELDLQGFTVDSVFVNQAQSTNFIRNNFSLKIPVNNANMNDTLSVIIYYHGIPTKDPQWGGFYFSGEYAYNIGVAMTDIPHNYGRVWYPCLDMFTDKSTYSLHVRTPHNKQAVCGGLLTDSLTMPDSTRIWTWQLTTPIPSYLTSVAVGNFQLYADTFHGINGITPINIYAPPTYYSIVPATFANLKSIIHHYETCFGAHQFEKVGYVIVSFSGGAMEHATNIAYPQFAVNGTDTYESLYAHELAHSWFGNLITCNNAEEMWINEGFASYCEAITNEYLYPNDDPELDGYHSTINNLHHTVLKNTHLDDGDYYALTQVPQSITYGSTSYDKGALVVHTLRHYLGDSLFFTGIQSLLQHYAFQAISSEQLFNFLSTQTNIDLTGFYEGWVNQPGFLHFSIDSIIPYSQNSSQYQVFIRQRLHHATHFANQNRVDISLFFTNNEPITINNFEFSGEYGVALVELPATPLFGVIDIDNQLADAVIDYNKTIAEAGTVNCSNANINIITDYISSPTWVRIEHNLVSPDPLKTENPAIYRISDSHYWRIEFEEPAQWSGTFQFRYYKATNEQLDYELTQGYTHEDLILLYRRNCTDDWQLIDFTRSGNQNVGSLKTTHLLPGEYTFAVGNRFIGTPNNESPYASLFPNPTDDTFKILTNLPIDKIKIVDAIGKKLYSSPFTNQTISVNNYPSGIYYVNLYSEGKLAKTLKLVKK